MDTLSPDDRRRAMAAVKGKDTTPELAVRRMVHAMGYRYRLHAKELPGKPDIVFRPRKKAIFVHGCFWHRHGAARCGKAVTPKTRRAYWQAKLDRNVARDAAAIRALRRAGWSVLVIWECELRRPERVARRLARFLA